MATSLTVLIVFIFILPFFHFGYLLSLFFFISHFPNHFSFVFYILKYFLLLATSQTIFWLFYIDFFIFYWPPPWPFVYLNILRGVRYSDFVRCEFVWPFVKQIMFVFVLQIWFWSNINPNLLASLQQNFLDPLAALLMF